MLGGDCLLDIYTFQRFNWNDAKQAKTARKFGLYLSVTVVVNTYQINLLEAGFIDTFRFLYPEEIKYSYWSWKLNARKKNVGWRIDYFLVNESLKDKIIDAKIYNEIEGSDHCPVSLVIEL